MVIHTGVHSIGGGCMHTRINAKMLKKRLQANLSFVTDVVEFVMNRMVQGGTVLSRVENGPNNSHITKELQGFHCFSFLLDHNKIGVGDNAITVWHHPRYKNRGNPKPVLSISWMVDVRQGELAVFSEDKEWQKAMRRLLKTFA